jgi:hypothetical protein
MQHCGDSGGAGAIMRTGINTMQPPCVTGGGTLYSYLVFGQSGQRFLNQWPDRRALEMRGVGDWPARPVVLYFYRLSKKPKKPDF